MATTDAVVVGSGPNGLTAAARLAQSGRRVLVIEKMSDVGGGTRTEELTLPGFLHDVCSAIHPFGIASPAYKELGIDIDWVLPPVAMSHPLDDGRVGALYNTTSETAAHMSRSDGERWMELVSPMVEDIDSLMAEFLGPRIFPNPLSRSERRMTLTGMRSAESLARTFESEEVRGMIAGLAAHSIAPLDSILTGGVALLFAAVGNSYGWPLVRGGSQGIANALAETITNHGGEIMLDVELDSLKGFESIPVFLDVMPPAALEIGGSRVAPLSRSRLRRWKPGPGVFKVDFALSSPIPWSDPVSSNAGTVHVGGTLDEVVTAEAAVARGDHPDKPFVLVAQQSNFDSSRAPNGQSTAWAYCHVPNGSTTDMTGALESQIERFAPGFTSTILERHARTANGFDSYNPNYVGGDIAGGRFGLHRYIPSPTNPYRIGKDLYLCSSSTPPGGGTHGLCGWHASGSAI